ncbi:hypothetical protein B0T21DRAFT_409479 [Apiosordaria backusii]|uniref:Uncharacterized protein n=1 Tax=Apiosordaria backusii TaxID=314023 RepID=A0AA40EF17_9PEZI|nr:hypothetical protein B0T21DRAFT_409479 [Apiosordaria backusii]
MDLPVDIRIIILEMAIEQKGRGWSAMASVCKEWQTYIEPRNFRRLDLHSSDLIEFSKIVVERRREFMRPISLNVKWCFPRYTVNNMKALEDLLLILSNWGPTTDQGFTLELDIGSACRRSSFWPQGISLDVPPLHNVTTLIIVHDLLWQVPHATLGLILDKLPHLEHLIWEPYRPSEPGSEDQDRSGYFALLSITFPEPSRA